MANSLKIILSMMCILLGTAAAHAAQPLTSDFSVTNAVVYVPLANSKSTMGFFTITNNSNKDVRIVGVSSTAAQQILLMPEPVVVVPAHQSVALKSSGRYLQINNLKGRLSTGDELHLIISLSTGQHIELVALAKSAYDQVHGH